jgi:four helix bundle protein
MGIIILQRRRLMDYDFTGSISEGLQGQRTEVPAKRPKDPMDGVNSGQKTDVRDRRSEVRVQEEARMRLNSAKDLEAYKKAYALAMEIFEVTKRFPKEERYDLTDQIRRSSRSVCLNLREAWAKRRYEAHFVSKLTDCDGENSETDSSLDFAKDCGYISLEEHQALVGKNREIGKMLGTMINNPQSFLMNTEAD